MTQSMNRKKILQTFVTAQFSDALLISHASELPESPDLVCQWAKIKVCKSVGLS